MAVKALLHYALEVPDPLVRERFYRSFGLAPGPARDQAVALRPSPVTRESVEYHHDLDYIPGDCAWQARDFPAQDALYKWGPPVPDDLALNRELES